MLRSSAVVFVFVGHWVRESGVDAVHIALSDTIYNEAVQGSAKRWAPGFVNAVGEARQKR